MISKAEEAESGTTANTGQVYGGAREDRIALNAERWSNYQICQQRGHQASNMILTSNPPKKVCRYCGTWYWNVTTQLEGNTPLDPDEYEQEEACHDPECAKEHDLTGRHGPKEGMQ